MLQPQKAASGHGDGFFGGCSPRSRCRFLAQLRLCFGGQCTWLYASAVARKPRTCVAVEKLSLCSLLNGPAYATTYLEGISTSTSTQRTLKTFAVLGMASSVTSSGRIEGERPRLQTWSVARTLWVDTSVNMCLGRLWATMSAASSSKNTSHLQQQETLLLGPGQNSRKIHLPQNAHLYQLWR